MNPNLENFEDLFETAAKGPVQEIITNDVGVYVPIPGEDASMADLYNTALQATNVLNRHGSLCVSLGAQMNTSKVSNYEQAAIETMSFQQKTMYERWKAGINLPPRNPTLAAPMRDPTTLGSHEQVSVKNDVVRLQIQAFNALYKVDDFTNTQRTYLLTKHKAISELMTAMIKVIKAKKDATSGIVGVSPEEFAEIQACKKLISSMGSTVNYHAAQARTVTQAVHHAQQLLQQRLSILPKLSSKKDVINVPLTAAQAFVGMGGPSRPLNLSAITSGGRMERKTVAHAIAIPRAADAAVVFPPANRETRSVALKRRNSEDAAKAGDRKGKSARRE
jgi:hypothetical protein